MGREIVQSYRGHLRYIPIFEITDWSTWSNQPTGDNYQVVSSSASDTQKVTIWYSVVGGTAILSETLTLNGTTAVNSSLATVNKVYGIFLGDNTGIISSRAVGTITLQKKTGTLAITTIAATKLASGVCTFYLAGNNVEVENIAGNTWFNAATPVNFNTNNAQNLSNPVNPPMATAIGASVQMSGRMAKVLKVEDYISLVSDASGSTAQITVFEG